MVLSKAVFMNTITITWSRLEKGIFEKQDLRCFFLVT
jgi:hypothetical protein